VAVAVSDLCISAIFFGLIITKAGLDIVRPSATEFLDETVLPVEGVAAAPLVMSADR
jgi:hypothetical protein